MGRLKTFEIVFDDNRTVYYPGQTLTGKCVVDLKGDMKMRCLQIFMRGVAKVHWTESRSTGNRLGAYTEHYNAEIEYFLKRQLLFGSVRGLKTVLDTELSGSSTLLLCHRCKANVNSKNGIVEDILQKGHHEFRFSFQLPPGGISTSFEGKHGSIRYWLKAEMDKLWSFNHTSKKAFTVISPIDINRSEYLTPVLNHVESTLCCWCCTSGPISLFAKTDRRGYCPGESIAITADFENLSKRTIIPHATLFQTQTFLANGKTRSRRSKFTIVTGVAIQPGRTANWDAQLLKIPAVSPSILNCCLIRVDYSVQITLQIPGAYNLTVDLPVVIGTTPFRTRSSYAISPELDALLQARMAFMTPAPPYRESETPPPPLEPPPSYAECVEGSVDIAEDEEGLMGDTRYTPLYAYVHDYQYHPPPAYSEIDPNPQLSLCGGSTSSLVVTLPPTRLPPLSTFVSPPISQNSPVTAPLVEGPPPAYTPTPVPPPNYQTFSDGCSPPTRGLHDVSVSVGSSEGP